MTPDELSRQLAGFPQLLSIQTPSPLEPLPQLTQKLNGPQIWIKRDDELGPGLGGNKGRKLAFIMAEVQSQNKRKVITYGGLQSNHARMTAAACAALGLEAHLFFFAKRPFPLTGNLLLNDLLGAKMHFIPFGSGPRVCPVNMNHFCPGLVALNRAKNPAGSRSQRKFILGVAEQQIMQVHDNMTPDCPRALDVANAARQVRMMQMLLK